jgi:hypothetical protein
MIWTSRTLYATHNRRRKLHQPKKMMKVPFLVVGLLLSLLLSTSPSDGFLTF